ncbi:MAG: hypothetical protein PHW63_03470 [Alphaproteobacteria bacterium]|nr:hypothetical protein [Alphaproteobacteria bacterium]
MTRASTTLLWLSLTIIVSLGLYHTSYRVEELGQQLRALNGDIEAEQRNLHVLKAEWVYLSNPARIEAAARQHLALQPTAPHQVTRYARLADIMPAKGESVSHYAAAAAARKVMTAANTRPRPIAAKPKAAADESDRLNTRLVIRHNAHAGALPDGTSLPLGDDQTLALAGSGTLQ